MPRRRASCLLFLATLGPAASPSLAQQPESHLKDGQPFHAHGQLQAKYRGWQRFLLLQLDRPSLADFGPASAQKPITALELRAPGQSSTLAEHVGEQVEATGTLQLDNVSPYYWNGVALLAQSVTLPGGAVLTSQRVQPRVPADTEFYTVTLAMVPHQFEWRRDAHDIETGDPLPDPDLDGCSLNGGGDIMNCLCIQGFTPVRAGVVPHPLPTTRWREIPASQFALPGMAQFNLPDPEATHPQVVQVACKRKGLTAK